MSVIETKNQLISAYETVLKPNSSVQERKDAELVRSILQIILFKTNFLLFKYCETLKSSGYLAFQLGVSLLDARNGHQLHLRNLGVNFIEHSLKSAQLDSLQLQSVKSQFWSLTFCEMGTFDALNEKVLLKEKVASCMAILACKLWLRPEDDPSQWNDFFEQGILQNVLKSQTISGNELLRRQEFALLTISQLINLVRSPGDVNEDKKCSSYLCEERRLQLHSGLEIVLPPFTDWLFQNFPSAVSSNVNPNVLNAAVSCFRSICTWMNNLNIEGIEAFLQSSLNALIQYEADETLTMNILDTLQNYFAFRAFSPAEMKVLEFYLISLFPQICQLLQKYSNDQDEEGYQKLKLLIESLLSVGNRYICNRKNPLIVRNLNDLISLFIALGQIPSLSIYLNLLEFFTNALKCEKISLKPHLPQLFLMIAGRLSKSVSEDRRSLYNEVDFEELAEFKEFHNLARVRSGEFLKTLTGQFPQQLLEFSYNAIGTFIQGNTWNTFQWGGLLFMEEYISRGLSNLSEEVKFDNLYLLHLQLLIIHSPVPSDNLVLEKWIACVKNFTALQGTKCPADDFRRSVEGLFNLAISADKPDSIRSLAAASILKLADANSSLFLPLLEPLLAAISPLLNGPTVSWERRLFSELILIFMSQPSLPGDKQMILFSAVADPLVDLLKNAKSVLLSSNDPAISLMKHVGFDELNSPSLSLNCRKFTSDLNLLLSTLQILFKRIGPLVQSQPQSPVVQTCLQVLDELVGFLMLMIQCVHRIGTRETWLRYFNNSTVEYEHFYPKMQEFLEIGTEESNNDIECNNPTTGSNSSPLVHIAGWTRHYRQTCYLVLGLAATNFKEFFYSLPHLSERFMTQPLSSLESLNLSDWNVLIKLLLKPVLSSASRDLIPVLVGASLTGLLALLGPKLENEWSLVLAANSSSKPATGTALALEMARESKCNTLSSGFINFLNDLFNVPAIDSMKYVSLLSALEQDILLPNLYLNDETIGLPSMWFFSEAPEALILSLNDFLCKAMITWPRSVGVYNRLVTIQIRLIIGVIGRPDFPKSALLSKSVNHALTCWNLETWNDFQTTLLVLLTEQYKWSYLLSAAEYHQGTMIFDPDSVKFVKNTRINGLTIFESELASRFPQIPTNELVQLRPSILCTEIPKSQRTNLKTFIQKYTKTLQIRPLEDLKQKELSNRLTEMKKRIGRGNVENTENFDSLLSDLFN